MMQIEDLTLESRRRIHEAHRAMTKDALVFIFEKTEEVAARAVRRFWAQYFRVSRRERDLVLHNDPVSLACEIAEVRWDEVPQDRLKTFNEMRRSTLEKLPAQLESRKRRLSLRR
jgi:hypothetical protein